MRQWIPAQNVPSHAGLGVLGDVVDAIALPGFAGTLLARLRSVIPGTSLSVYRTGAGHRPQRYMGASHLAPDETRACWRAYMSGPWMRDETLTPQAALPHEGPMVCHVTAPEVPPEHRTKVYEAHGLAERVSVVRREADGSLFTLNVYRHVDHVAFSDVHLAGFAELAPAVLATTRKHLAVLGLVPTGTRPANPVESRCLLSALDARLTPRELDVCERMLRGLTDEGVAADLGLGLPTVRTYRSRAFGRLGIHFRNELFALVRTRGG